MGPLVTMPRRSTRCSRRSPRPTPAAAPLSPAARAARSWDRTSSSRPSSACRARRPDRQARDLRADPVRRSSYETLDEAIALHNGVPQGLSSRHLHRQPAQGRGVPVGAAGPIAASPTSTSARRVRKSAARSAARRKPAAAANRDPTRGRPTCAGRPTPSTGPRAAAGAGHQVRLGLLCCRLFRGGLLRGGFLRGRPLRSGLGGRPDSRLPTPDSRLPSSCPCHATSSPVRSPTTTS